MTTLLRRYQAAHNRLFPILALLEHSDNDRPFTCTAASMLTECITCLMHIDGDFHDFIIKEMEDRR